ncbi:helix-turn-helix transcriptional regulator [Halobacillus shinanisalinarum]|uniref:Helix-turn-helix transcriptional regulator n=1 Tax=Halobacillus shinanisalinarum TaxID=2932258 RepID=A0ABY4H3R4_9BACI|nr:helix-turn-helix transcriptional regulator [Halobacillus shinanisalinarum]UOQ95096.1 helix-turn-helix transcriptional regulator [Halobacillus shinanisalinarum]
MKREKLVKYRKKENWSQRQVVEELNSNFNIKITDSYYGMIEKGVRNPSIKLAVAIANLFNVMLEDIFLNK